MITVNAVDPLDFRDLAPVAASVYGAAMERSPEVVVQRRDIIAVHVTYPDGGGHSSNELELSHQEIAALLTAPGGERS